jgi:hypothetical protein
LTLERFSIYVYRNEGKECRSINKLSRNFDPRRSKRALVAPNVSIIGPDPAPASEPSSAATDKSHSSNSLGRGFRTGLQISLARRLHWMVRYLVQQRTIYPFFRYTKHLILSLMEFL